MKNKDKEKQLFTSNLKKSISLHKKIELKGEFSIEDDSKHYLTN